MNNFLTVIGAGLAGSEAAWQAAERGVKVILYEMRPVTATPAHKTENCAELVCSNSLGNNLAYSAPFILKEELRSFNSIIIDSGDNNSVPAGSALAVDRDLFAQEVTAKLSNHPNITIKREEVVEIPPEGPVIIATGPLTSPRLSDQISKLIGQEYLYFYDALSPIVNAATIDYDKAFFASRYDKGDADYLNCPMNVSQYYEFVRELKASDKVSLSSFEKPIYFEGCMPIEVLAERGDRTLAFGPLKPVGLPDPKTGTLAHAVVQLRRENKESSAFNLVGFQTKLTYPEQKRIFSKIPGLENAEFFRFGAIHRNTYINSPSLLNNELELLSRPGTYFAGQVTGVEGYVESSAMGLLASLSAVAKIMGTVYKPPPADTALGALLNYITLSRKQGFQPMNINFGLFWVQEMKIKDKKMRNQKIATNAMEKLKAWKDGMATLAQP
ncbi:MAG: methylenetetrahydrofolate--tRNA-(uracil(54)-C(5))-methyltransferase (FADH(2)-oxidizing) TrmFO [Nitrospinaceae bacterium]|nr:methylenetetrahydrofolate--tRNA-(uracil(54)-C(5))-methyltransferase (FADH(2)-oxidizing) TrmFO [Nitrospinaceae bacterium]MBT5867649.1 methylenetetrahydrofolate--tRNA-(uracil(54)-C(5))-methyltransferase (FADH(2)-oxidizing) TrmFO [Nitrospinaceae bacterium]MBT6347404.1 methylenetetrahydrofolate--tRNA-(uracil(54)-C(5))-methyltransferase (FADH(2)-oxidizing) TrmFO [Nitrospina sp.]